MNTNHQEQIEWGIRHHSAAHHLESWFHLVHFGGETSGRRSIALVFSLWLWQNRGQRWGGVYIFKIQNRKAKNFRCCYYIQRIVNEILQSQLRPFWHSWHFISFNNLQSNFNRNAFPINRIRNVIIFLCLIVDLQQNWDFMTTAADVLIFFLF